MLFSFLMMITVLSKIVSWIFYQALKDDFPSHAKWLLVKGFLNLFAKRIEAVRYFKSKRHRNALLINHIGPSSCLFQLANSVYTFTFIKHLVLLRQHLYEYSWSKVVETFFCVFWSVAEKILFCRMTVKIKEKINFLSP